MDLVERMHSAMTDAYNSFEVDWEMSGWHSIWLRAGQAADHFDWDGGNMLANELSLPTGVELGARNGDRIGDEVRRRVLVDPNLDAYVSFIDHDWVQEAEGISKGAVKLNELLFDLVLNWKGAANTRRLPWLAVEQVASFAEGLMRDAKAEHRAFRMINFVSANLSNRVVLNSAEKTDIDKALADLCHEANERMKAVPCAYPKELAWREMLESPEFQVSLWSSQRICYSAVYHAYEDLLVQCVRLQRGDPEFRLKNYEDFKQAMKDAFGEPLCRQCWIDDSVSVPRLVRHALSHNGGRETRELKARRHGLPVIDGVIQIRAKDVTAVFNALKAPAKALFEHAASLPNFL